MSALYGFAQDREFERMKFLARLLGAEVDSERKEKTVVGKQKQAKKEQEPNFMLFKHQSEYSHLTQAEKQKLTEQMRSIHRQALRNVPKTIGKG